MQVLVRELIQTIILKELVEISSLKAAQSRLLLPDLMVQALALVIMEYAEPSPSLAALSRLMAEIKLPASAAAKVAPAALSPSLAALSPPLAEIMLPASEVVVPQKINQLHAAPSPSPAA